MSNVFEEIQGLVDDYQKADKKAGFLFVVVTSEDPLEITLLTDGKIVLKKRFLIVAQHLTDYEIPYEILSIEKATHREKLSTEITNIREVNGLYVEHDGKHYVEPDPPGEFKRFDGQGTIKLLNHLLLDDKVILLRMEGGHAYFVIDRLPKEVEDAG